MRPLAVHTPYAAKLRRLHHLEKQVKRLAEQGMSEHQRNKLALRFRALMRSVRSAVNAKWWLKSAICIAIYLQISLTEVTGQQFAAPLTNPFGIQGINDYSFYKAVDIDDDGDQDIFGIGYDYYYTPYAGRWILQFYENTGTPENNMYQVPTDEAFGIDLEVLPEAICLFTFGDLDDDGDFDLLANVDYEYTYGNYIDSYKQLFAYYENTGTKESAQFTAPEFFSVDNASNPKLGPIVLEDIDDDGDLDLFSNAVVYFIQNDSLVYGIKTVYYENTGTPQDFEFTEGPIHPFGIYGLDDPGILVTDFGDLDGDGDPDLLADLYDPDAALASFVYQENIGTSSSPAFGMLTENPFQLDESFKGFRLPQLIDLDNDGDLDLLTHSYDYNTGEVSIDYFENLSTAGLIDLSRLGIHLELAPNPATTTLSLTFEGIKFQDPNLLQIKDQFGNTLKELHVREQQVIVDVQSLSSGLYYARLLNHRGQITRKFVKIE